MRLCEIWKEQCDAARQIEAEFGTQNALDYLIGEKFLNFLQAAETDAQFRAEIPAFVGGMKTIFETWQLAEYLEAARQSEPFDPSDCEDDDAEMVVCEHAGGSFDGCPDGPTGYQDREADIKDKGLLWLLGRIEQRARLAPRMRATRLHDTLGDIAG
jgi:hypothetical protein